MIRVKIGQRTRCGSAPRGHWDDLGVPGVLSWAGCPAAQGAPWPDPPPRSRGGLCMATGCPEQHHLPACSILCCAIPRQGTAPHWGRAADRSPRAGSDTAGGVQGQESQQKSLNHRTPDSPDLLFLGAKKGNHGQEQGHPGSDGIRITGSGILQDAPRGFLNFPN